MNFKDWASTEGLKEGARMKEWETEWKVPMLMLKNGKESKMQEEEEQLERKKEEII